MAHDTIPRHSPAASAELAWLRQVTVGSTRPSPLFPALDIPVEWICTAVSTGRWEFEGRFCGQFLLRMAITQHEDTVTLDLLEQS